MMFCFSDYLFKIVTIILHSFPSFINVFCIEFKMFYSVNEKCDIINKILYM